MTFRSFIYNLILIALMFVAFVYASKLGMEAAIKHMDAQEAAMWEVAKGESHAK
jgi:hypothetical protein